jgi:3-dehydroquinate synthase
MAVIPVALAGRSYEVRVGGGLLPDLAAQCGPLLRKARVPIVTDENVHRLWGHVIEDALRGADKEPRWLVHEPGEQAKSWQGLSRTVDWLLAEEVERGDHIIALGGGVIGDLTGFASSCRPLCWRRWTAASAARRRSIRRRARTWSARSISRLWCWPIWIL